MRVSFTELPGGGGILRPVVGVRVAGLRVPQTCLVDTGTAMNRFPRWLATAAGIPVGDADVRQLGLGGTIVEAVRADVDLELGDHRWRATSTFCDPWPFDFSLLGLDGFFDHFRVEFRAARSTLEIEPERE